MKRSTKISVAAALAASFTLVGPAAYATSGQPHPCPGQEIPVYKKIGGGKVHDNDERFVCAGDVKGKDGKDGKDGATGPKGDTGASGADGAPGATGPAGPAGPAGAAGPKGDTGDTGAPGQPGANGNDGATGPAGPAGPQGGNGNDGAPGATGPAGPAGETGATGAQGAAGANGSDGAPGATGAVGATGDTGPEGIPGQSAWILSERFEGYKNLCASGNGTVFAYGVGEVVLEQGVTEYAIVCDGTDGANGTDGKSAYDIAVENGFVGSVTDWLDSLQGAQGEQGIEGPQGPKGTPGKVTVVHEDGTQSEVPIEELPKTGGNNEVAAWAAGLGAFALLAGVGTVVVARARRQ